MSGDWDWPQFSGPGSPVEILFVVFRGFNSPRERLTEELSPEDQETDESAYDDGKTCHHLLTQAESIPDFVLPQGFLWLSPVPRHQPHLPSLVKFRLSTVAEQRHDPGSCWLWGATTRCTRHNPQPTFRQLRRRTQGSCKTCTSAEVQMQPGVVTFRRYGKAF